MKRQTKFAGVGGVFLALSLIVSGCAAGPSTPTEPTEEVDAEWQAVIDAATEEGKVVWYTVAPKAVQDALKEGFEAKYPGITLEVTALGSLADINTALETERETGVAGGDVVTTVDYKWIWDHMEEGWLADLEGPAWENPEWDDYVVNGQVAQAGLGVIVLSWNTTLFPEGVESYEDLLDPRLTGTIGVGQATSGIGADYWQFIEEEHVPDFIEKIGALDPVVYPSAFAVQDATAAGEVAVGLFTSAADMLALQESGAPVEFIVPDPAWAAVNSFFIMENAHNPNAAQLLMNYFASAEGQAATAVNGFSPLSEVETLAGDNAVVLTNVERLLDPKWHPAFLERWNAALGQ